MKKEKITMRQRWTGVFLGITLALLMLVLTSNATITSGDFWLRQNEKNNHSVFLNLASNDDYNHLYHHYIALLEGKVGPDKSETVTVKGENGNVAAPTVVRGPQERPCGFAAPRLEAETGILCEHLPRARHRIPR